MNSPYVIVARNNFTRCDWNPFLCVSMMNTSSPPRAWSCMKWLSPPEDVKKEAKENHSKQPAPFKKTLTQNEEKCVRPSASSKQECNEWRLHFFDFYFSNSSQRLYSGMELLYTLLVLQQQSTSIRCDNINISARSTHPALCSFAHNTSGRRSPGYPLLKLFPLTIHSSLIHSWMH